MTDPFQNFAEQQRSYEMLEQHRQLLLNDAIEMRGEHPGLEVVGMVLDADATEATSLRAALQQATGQDFAGRGFVGVAPRDFVLQLLRASAPAALEWLPAGTHADGTKVLPMVAITKHGVRFGAVPFPAN